VLTMQPFRVQICVKFQHSYNCY